MTQFPKLLSPIAIGSKTLKNRSVMTAHATRYSWGDPKDSGERQISYVARRAAGGIGMIVHEPLMATPIISGDTFQQDYLAERTKRLCESVKQHQTLIVQQLMAPGVLLRSARPDFDPLMAFSPSANSNGEAAHVMTADEIEAYIAGFTQLARLMIAQGMDGIELHGAHGYLIQQSLSPWANQRDDEWGEPLHFLRSLISSLRSEIGQDALLGLRMCVDDFRDVEDGGLGSDRLIAYAQQMATEGQLDYINHSEGSSLEHYAQAIGSWRHPHGEFLPLAKRLKQAVGPTVPVIGVGRIVTPELAETALEQGYCDLVGLARSQIADPDFMAKTSAGTPDRIRPCVGANQGCIDRNLLGLPISCLVNPDVGQEATTGDPNIGESPRKILVAGAGPAGLKAAEIAARRGHKVTVFEQSDQLGGRLRLASTPEIASELAEVTRWMIDELKHLDVEIHLNHEVNKAVLQEQSPDAMVLATGATPQPQLTTIGKRLAGYVDCLSVDAAMQSNLSGQNVVVFDTLGALEAVRCAEKLRREGANVAIVTAADDVGSQIGFTHKVETIPLLAELGCRILTNREVESFESGRLTLKSNLAESPISLECGTAVISDNLVANDALCDVISDLSIPVRVVGDARAPRNAMSAIHDGAEAGRLI